MNVSLTDQNFNTTNTFSASENGFANTGGFVPFGTSTKEGQEIKCDVKCNGCI